MLRNTLTGLAVIVISLFSAGCEHGVQSPAGDQMNLESILEDHSSTADPRERWKAYGLKDYVIEQERLCFCPPPHGFIRLVIRDNQVVEGYSEDGTKLTAEELQWRKTVDELFDWIEEASATNPRRLDVEYDSKHGYPTHIGYDQSEFIADEEMTYSLRGLQRIAH